MTDISIIKGDTVIFDIYATRFNSVTGLDEAIPLTGAKAWFTVKSNSRDLDVDAIIIKNNVDDFPDIRILDAALGIIRVTILPAETDALPASSFPFDIQIKESDGTVSTIEKGFLQLDRDITITTA